MPEHEIDKILSNISEIVRVLGEAGYEVPDELPEMNIQDEYTEVNFTIHVPHNREVEVESIESENTEEDKDPQWCLVCGKKCKSERGASIHNSRAEDHPDDVQFVDYEPDDDELISKDNSETIDKMMENADGVDTGN